MIRRSTPTIHEGLPVSAIHKKQNLCDEPLGFKDAGRLKEAHRYQRNDKTTTVTMNQSLPESTKSEKGDHEKQDRGKK
jgi:hypothetical protein